MQSPRLRRIGALFATVAHLVVLGAAGFLALAIIGAFAAAGILTVIFIIGVPLLALSLLLLLGLSWFERERIAGLYGVDVMPAKLRQSPRTDWLRGPHRVWRILTDADVWRALLSFALASLLGAFTIPLLGLVGVGVPLAFAGLGQADSMVIPFTGFIVPISWAPLVGTLSFVIGLAGSFGLALAHRSITTGLLAVDDRAILEQEARDERERRQGAVRAADFDRTRIERDLHDGVQPRLVSIAMQLGMARDKVATDPEAAQRLIDEAHVSAKSAVTELRQLARGIHVAVLDDRGLDAAVSALAARSAVPVEVDSRIDGRCNRDAEIAVYFAVAEGITNAQKHSRASRIRVALRTRHLRGDVAHLWARVEDDGIGGAERQPGGGIDGLANRVAGVGGTLTMTSPAGGPTAIEVEVPCAS